MPKKIIQLERELAERLGREHCVMCSRGTTALTLAFRMLGHSDGQVILPANLCQHPSYAALYAGLTPHYCDVSRKDYNHDLKDLEHLLSTEKDVRAVLLSHNYGYSTDVPKVLELAKKYKTAVVEDAAQALGGEYDGKPLGSFGTFSILSFSHTKIIDVGTGGAVLFDDDRFEKPLREALAALPAEPNDYGAWRKRYRNAYYAVAGLTREDRFYKYLYKSFADLFQPIFLHNTLHPDTAGAILEELPRLSQYVERRRYYAEKYRDELKHPSVTHPQYRNNGVPWRYCFTVKGDFQRDIAEEVRDHNVHVSHWHPSVHEMMSTHPRKLKNAEYLDDHIFNLWLEPKYSEDYIRRNITIFMKALRDHEKYLE